jgi:hypothetical protein
MKMNEEYKSEKRKYAKQLLTHYFISSMDDKTIHFDVQAEIESIVDLIIDAAIEEHKIMMKDGV